MERQLYESRFAWQKKIVFPFVVAAKENANQFFIRKSFQQAKEKIGLFTRFALKRSALDAAR